MSKDNNENYSGKLYAYLSIAFIVLSAVFLGLMFTVLGIYALIGSILSALAALAFANVQKRKNDFNGLKIIRIAAYAFLIISMAVFAGGIIWGQISRN